MIEGSQETRKLAAVQVMLDPELARRFRIVSIRKGESMSDILRKFVEWYVSKEEA